jgi:hypothetical protein
LTRAVNGAIVEQSSLAADCSHLASPDAEPDKSPITDRDLVLFSSHPPVAHSRGNTSADHAIDPVCAVIQGHGARAGAMIRHRLEVRRAIHCRQQHQQRY